MIREARIAWLLAFVVGCTLQYTVPGEGETLVCEAPEFACGARCVELDDDPDHCGVCGRACALDEVCIEGECESACDDGELCGNTCVETDDDPANCGGCNHWCDNDEVCEDGQCLRECDESCGDNELCVDGECTCRSGFSVCDDECVDLRTDDGNCGMCDRGCDGDPCGGGECLDDDCAPFPDACEHACTDVQTDPLACGACGRECHPSQQCIAGECVSAD